MPVTVIPGAYGGEPEGRGHPTLAHRCGEHRKGLSITVAQAVAESRRAGGTGMSLMTVGRNAVLIEQLKQDPPAGETPEQRAEREKREAAQKLLLDQLSAWIPGDFIVAYTTLLSSWSQLQANFRWLLVIAAISSFVFVWGTAFSTSGFKTAKDRPFVRLTVRTVLGFVVAVYASAAIPTSGWYDLDWFADNQTSVIATAAVISAGLVLFLKGFQKLMGEAAPGG
jgi:hypothetical protein